VVRSLLRFLLPLFLGIVPASCGPTCSEIDISTAPPASEADFIVTFPENAFGIFLFLGSVPENPERPVIWSIRQEAARALPNPLRISYGVVPKGMVQEEKALPLKEGVLVRVTAQYSTGSYWNPVCHSARLYRRVGGRFVEAPEGRE
jgi:hypothetical protein